MPSLKILDFKFFCRPLNVFTIYGRYGQLGHLTYTIYKLSVSYNEYDLQLSSGF